MDADAESDGIVARYRETDEERLLEFEADDRTAAVGFGVGVHTSP